MTVCRFYQQGYCRYGSTRAAFFPFAVSPPRNTNGRALRLPPSYLSRPAMS